VEDLRSALEQFEEIVEELGEGVLSIGADGRMKAEE
jgi:hypothetical protein